MNKIGKCLKCLLVGTFSVSCLVKVCEGEFNPTAPFSIFRLSREIQNEM